MMPCLPNFAWWHRSRPPIDTAHDSDAAAAATPKPTVNSVNQDPYKPVQVFVQSKRNVLHDGRGSVEGHPAGRKQPSQAADSSLLDTATAGKADKCEQADIDVRRDRRPQGNPTPRKWRKADSIGTGSFGSVHLGLNSDTGGHCPVRHCDITAAHAGCSCCSQQLPACLCPVIAMSVMAVLLWGVGRPALV